MEFELDKKELFQLGKGFEMGLVSFESLTESQKYDLSKYFAIKNEMLDKKIQDTTYALTSMNNKLDEVYNELMNK